MISGVMVLGLIFRPSGGCWPFPETRDPGHAARISSPAAGV